MIRRARPLVLLAFAVVALSGCFSGEPKVAVVDQVGAEQAQALAATESGGAASPAPGGGGGETLTFVGVDIAYESAPDTAPAGSLTFELDNQGGIVHNVVIDEVGTDPIVEAPAGETATGNATLEPGSYTYYCSIAGHRAAGMEGTLEVQ